MRNEAGIGVWGLWDGGFRRILGSGWKGKLEQTCRWNGKLTARWGLNWDLWDLVLVVVWGIASGVFVDGECFWPRSSPRPHPRPLSRCCRGFWGRGGTMMGMILNDWDDGVVVVWGISFWLRPTGPSRPLALTPS